MENFKGNLITTYFLQTALSIFNTTFASLYPIIVEILLQNGKPLELKCELRFHKLLPWILQITVFVGGLIFSSAYALISEFYQSGRQLDLVQISLYTYYFSGAVVYCAHTWLFIQTCQEFVLGFNYIFKTLINTGNWLIIKAISKTGFLTSLAIIDFCRIYSGILPSSQIRLVRFAPVILHVWYDFLSCSRSFPRNVFGLRPLHIFDKQTPSPSLWKG